MRSTPTCLAGFFREGLAAASQLESGGRNRARFAARIEGTRKQLVMRCGKPKVSGYGPLANRLECSARRGDFANDSDAFWSDGEASGRGRI